MENFGNWLESSETQPEVRMLSKWQPEKMVTLTKMAFSYHSEKWKQSIQENSRHLNESKVVFIF